jgi:hypothetical protein
MGSARVGEELSTEKRCAGELDARYDALRALTEDGVPFVVAGAYAFFEYTGIFRDTKDLDVFLRRRDVPHAFASLERAGFRTELLDSVWIAKGYRGEWYVDLIFSSGNGVCVVDDAWFAHAHRGVVMKVPVLLAPPEEIIWSKGFVCERDRFDGNDVANLIRARGDELDWDRLLARFDEDWEVLLAQLVLFRYVFPSDRAKVPSRIMRKLMRRAARTAAEGAWERRVCRGPLLSKTQYRHVLEHLPYEDGCALRGLDCDPEDGMDSGGAREEFHAELSPGGGG